jgi:hypothetical protein
LVPTFAVEFTSPATSLTRAVAVAVPFVELATEVALALTGNEIEESAPAVNVVSWAPIAAAVSAMDQGREKLMHEISPIPPPDVH